NRSRMGAVDGAWERVCTALVAQAGRVRRGRAGGRPPAFDREAYKQRNTVERCINRLKQWRGIATRYEKTATIHLAGLHIAGVFLWSAR
ncbi:transposase, partial [Streptosporangium sandarakinum]